MPNAISTIRRWATWWLVGPQDRCGWCGRVLPPGPHPTSGLRPFCSAEHAQEHRDTAAW